MPAPKRRYGYFCLPILCGDRIVGRLDPKADRPAKRLLVRRLVLEEAACDRNVADTDLMLAGLARELHAFARFNGCQHVDVQHATPHRFRSALRRELARVE